MGDIPVFTTAELVIAESIDIKWTRPHDESTGYPELAVERR